jgi:6-phosphogluconate dehydrogenase
MLPAAAVEGALAALSELLQPGDIVVDGGNSHYVDDIHRARVLQARQIDYVDAGVSGGVWGGQRGYRLMIGGAAAAVSRLIRYSTAGSGSRRCPGHGGAQGGGQHSDQGYPAGRPAPAIS